MGPNAPFWLKLAHSARFSSVFDKIYVANCPTWSSRSSNPPDSKIFSKILNFFQNFFLSFPIHLPCQNYPIRAKIWSYWQKSVFSTYSVMVWRKFAYTASVARTEAKCDFLAKSQILSTDTKPRFADHLSGSKQNQWPYQNRASLLISISTENSKNDRKMTPLPPQTWI